VGLSGLQGLKPTDETIERPIPSLNHVVIEQVRHNILDPHFAWQCRKWHPAVSANFSAPQATHHQVHTAIARSPDATKYPRPPDVFDVQGSTLGLGQWAFNASKPAARGNHRDAESAS